MHVYKNTKTQKEVWKKLLTMLGPALIKTKNKVVRQTYSLVIWFENDEETKSWSIRLGICVLINARINHDIFMIMKWAFHVYFLCLGDFHTELHFEFIKFKIESDWCRLSPPEAKILQETETDVWFIVFIIQWNWCFFVWFEWIMTDLCKSKFWCTTIY